MISEENIKEIIKKSLVSLCYTDWRKSSGWGSVSGDDANLWSTAEIYWLIAKWSSLIANHFGYRITPNNDNMPTIEKILEDAKKWIINKYRYEESDRIGGFAATDNKPIDPVSTAFALNVLTHTNTDQDKIEACIRFLQSTQGDDGGWREDAKKAAPSDLITTSIVSLSLARVELGTDYTIRPVMLSNARSLYRKTAIKLEEDKLAWPERADTDMPDIRGTCYAIYTIASIWGDDYLVSRGIAYLRQNQNPNGSWGKQRDGDIEDTAWAINALLYGGLHHKSSRIAHGIEYLVNGFGEHGRYYGCQPPSIRKQLSVRVSTPATFYALETLFTYWKAINEQRGKSYINYVLKRSFDVLSRNLSPVTLLIMLAFGIVIFGISLSFLPLDKSGYIGLIVGLLFTAIPVAVGIYKGFRH